MAVKIRLARHGKKNYAFYNIIVADSRAPRDGRFIERIGSYNPNTNPAFIELDSDRALYWLGVGAQPTDTCRRILSHEGILLKKHLAGGVKKGALTEEAAQERWNAWRAEKDAKVQNQKDSISSKKNEAKKASESAEALVNEERAKAIAKRRQEEAEALKAAEAKEAKEAAEEAPAQEETPVEVEAPVQEETPVQEEAPVQEVAEAPVEEPAEEPAATEETPAE